MARNMITGIETQKMQEYTQEQIDRAEHMGIAIPADVKEQIFEYANLVGEEEKVRTLVRNLADAVNRSDEDRVEELLDDAQMDIQDLPDPTIGKLELRDYGYTAEDMVPLRKAAALDYHRMGSKIYCLGSDGSKGEYASKEMIQAHEGLFGMESQMWERIRDQDLDYADEDFGAFQEPMNVIGQEEALKLYDAGADIYLITNFSSPIYVTERMEIERGPEHYQMSTEELERFRNLEWEMQKYPQIQSLKEANLLLGTRRTFGIYQIRDGLPGENYAFMNMSFIESHGMQIKKEDYELVYVGELFGNMSLDDIFERFNIDRPEDFRGHSLSVSDIVVLNEGGKVTAHFVDSISFEQLDSFLNLEEQVLSELAYEVGDRYFAIQRTEGGYDYSFYDEDFRLMDGGVYENGEISIEEAAEELLEDEGWTGERIRGDYDQLMKKVEEMDMVLGSPAICIYRSNGRSTARATSLAKVFVNNFNLPESTAIIDLAYGRCRDDNSHWQNVLKYCKDGCFQAMIDEYIHMLKETAGFQSDGNQYQIVHDMMMDSLKIHTATYIADTYPDFKKRINGADRKSDGCRIRSSYAVGFTKDAGDNSKVVMRKENIRNAFNSPMRPFVLATTSIGQEGLDFHNYCRVIMHWNLPSNPIDVGRILRTFKIKKNVEVTDNGKIII